MTQSALYPRERESRDATKNIGSEAIKVSVAMYRFAIHSGSVEQWLHYSENTDRYSRKGNAMSDRIDNFAKTVAERTTRRSALMGLGALALGSLGILGMGQGTRAKNDNDNECNDCKQTCKENNKKPGKKTQTNCTKKCNNKCNNN